MAPDPWQRLAELFEAALARAPDARAAFLSEACADDVALRAEVEALLAAHERAGSFIERPALERPLDPAELSTLGEDAVPARVLRAGSRLGPYEVVELLAAGGMGQVYRARDPRLDRDVAIKVLPRAGSPGEARRLQREARAAGSLNHPNILVVYDVGVEGEPFYVVAELLEGTTLRERLAAGPLALSECLDYAGQIAAGVAAAHEKGIVHRDLKPENLFLTRDGRVKVLDFGLAKQTGPWEPAPAAATGASRTAPGTVLGTVGYMSPEQVRGGEADPRSDVFSLGAVLYELLAGRRAFVGGSAVETMNAILTQEPPPLAGGAVPPFLERLVKRCLEKDPAARFRSAGELAAALLAGADALRGGQPVGRPPGPAAGASIAVLPFLNMTGEAEQEYFCEGMAEELIGALGGISDLRVAARSSTFRFKGRPEGLERIGRELRVEKILEGSVRRSGRRLRISVQLVNAADGYHLWSEKYDRDIEDVFALQDEIAARVAAELRPQLQPPPARARRRSPDLPAYQLYLKGVHFWNKRDEGGLRQAVEAFQAACAHDPAYASAHAGLAECYGVLGLSHYDLGPAREAMARAAESARRALELEPELAAAHAALAWVALQYDWDWPSAETSFRRALELEPERAMTRHWYSHYLSAMGRSDEALVEARRAWELDPLSSIANANLARAHYHGRRFAEAADVARRLIELDPGFPVAHHWLGLTCAAQGRYAEAIAAFEASAVGGGASRALALVGHARARAGEASAARGALEELQALVASRYVPAYHLALVHVGLDQRDLALACLERAYDERVDQLAYLGVEPLLDPLRGEPRFVALHARLRLPLAAPAPSLASPPPGGTPRRRAVAVLPFRDLAQDPEAVHLGLSLADATITELARLPALLVRPTSAILRYEGGGVDARQAARELAVEAVLEASFQRAGSRLRVTAQLLEAAEGRPLWAERFDVGLDDLFELQDEVARSIARALALELGPAEARRLAAGRPPRGPSAATYELYVRGKRHLFVETLADCISAVDWFEKAREADPGFALAWAGLADAYARLAFAHHPQGDWYARARSMCARALELDPALPEARYVRARLCWAPQAGFDNAAALRDLVPALQARPNLEEAWVLLGNVLHHVGLLAEARRLYEHAEALSPGHARARAHALMCLVAQGRYAEGLALWPQVTSEKYAFVEYWGALCQIHLGRLGEAEATLERLARLTPYDVLVHPLRGLLAARRGAAEEADRQLDLIRENEAAYGHYHHAQYDAACIEALLGRRESAVEWLGQAARGGYPCLAQVERDEFLDGLRGAPGFERLLAELRAECEGYERLYAELRAAAPGGP